jgi:hypothetical protein
MVLFTLILGCWMVWQTEEDLLIISMSKTFLLLAEVADRMTFREMCPHFCQVPSKQAVICDGSYSSFSATASLAAYIMKDTHQPQLSQ